MVEVYQNMVFDIFTILRYIYFWKKQINLIKKIIDKILDYYYNKISNLSFINKIKLNQYIFILD